jgi:hypothetical protein
MLLNKLYSGNEEILNNIATFRKLPPSGKEEEDRNPICWAL